MTKQNQIGLFVTATILGTAIASSAMAAPKPVCQNYANVAVSQYQTMLRLGIGCSGPRWHNWYDGHYQWCRSTSKASAQSETFVRKRTIFSGQC